MPILSLEELDAILKQYAKGSLASIKEKKSTVHCIKPHLVANLHQHMSSHSDIGPNAKVFMTNSVNYYQQAKLSPPFNAHNIDIIYQLLAPLNNDLCGNKEGDAFEQQRAMEWEKTWDALSAEFLQEGRELSLNELKKAQQDILCAYRQRILQLSVFKPKGPQTLEIDEIRVQDYLININNCMTYLTPSDAYTHLHHKFMHDFENDLWLDMQTLSRYLNMNQRAAYLKKFEEMTTRKTVEFLGSDAITKLFKAITQDKEFLRQLPLLIDEGNVLRKFIIQYPDKKKRDELLTASMYEILASENNNLHLVHAMMQKTSVN